MNSYEARKQDRIDRLRERAEGKEAESDALVEAGMSALREIPFGQPILVGHHSEKRDRAYRARAGGKIDRGMERSREAEELQRRADAAANNHAISSDDPDAPDKLRERIAKLEHTQAQMVAVNKIIRQKPKNEPTPEKLAALMALEITEETARKLFEPDYSGRVGIPSYSLQNRNANIRRLRLRLEQIEQRARVAEAHADEKPTETESPAGFTIREDYESNRLQLIFPGKPTADVRAELKSHGFRWAPSAGAWQRQLNNGARHAAEMVATRLLRSATA